MSDQTGRKIRPLAPRAIPQNAHRAAENLEDAILTHASTIVREGFAKFPDRFVFMGANLPAIQNLLRDKIFDYFKRRLDQDDIKKIREDHRIKASQLDVKDSKNRSEIQKLDHERQEKIMQILHREFDSSALIDEIRMRFPQNANKTRLTREYIKLRDMRVEDLLEAHANREYAISDEEVERLKDAPLPLPMFGGEVLALDQDGTRYTLVQLTNASHLAQETRDLDHCINEEDAGYRRDIIARLPNGTMKAACFSIRKHKPDANLATDYKNKPPALAGVCV